MLQDQVSADVIAAHEAGHVVVALHLGIHPVGVRLVPKEGSPAGTEFDPDELAAVPHEQRELLAFSGLAGQLVAGTYWSKDHVRTDREWLLNDWDMDRDRTQGGGMEVLQEHGELFNRVRVAIETGLGDEVPYLTIDQLMQLE